MVNILFPTIMATKKAAVDPHFVHLVSSTSVWRLVLKVTGNRVCVCIRVGGKEGGSQ